MWKNPFDDNLERKKLPFFDQFFIWHSMRHFTDVASFYLYTKPLRWVLALQFHRWETQRFLSCLFYIPESQAHLVACWVLPGWPSGVCSESGCGWFPTPILRFHCQLHGWLDLVLVVSFSGTRDSGHTQAIITGAGFSSRLWEGIWATSLEHLERPESCVQRSSEPFLILLILWRPS